MSCCVFYSEGPLPKVPLEGWRFLPKVEVPQLQYHWRREKVNKGLSVDSAYYQIHAICSKYNVLHINYSLVERDWLLAYHWTAVTVTNCWS